MLQVYLLPSLEVELHFRKCTDVLGEIVELRAGWLFYQLKDLLIAFPSSDLRLGVSDIQDHLQMVVVQAVIPLFHNHLVAVGEPYWSSQVASLKLFELTTNESPSQWPTTVSVPT